MLADHTNKQHPKEDHQIKCEECHEKFETNEAKETHKQAKHYSNKQYNCNECDHQTTDSCKLDKHINIAHNISQGTHEKDIKIYCISCAQGFQFKSSLIKHRLDAHGKSKVKCCFKADKTCRNGANNGENCLYDHSDDILEDQTNKSKCNICDESFNYKSQFLKHRKTNHPQTVPPCKTVKEGKICQFSERCGFGHEPLDNQQLPQTHVTQDVPSPTENTTTTSAAQNFWEGPKIIKQPTQMEEMKQMMEKMMMEIHQMKLQLNK